MSVLAIYLTQKSGKDDVITVYDYAEYPDYYQISYSASDLHTPAVFHMSGDATLEYIEGILASLKRDTDPFACIQISTRIHPSVIYNVADLEDCDVSSSLVSHIVTALRTRVMRV